MSNTMRKPVMLQVIDERKAQIAKGYTPEHDDRHTLDEIVGFAEVRLGALPVASLDETVTLLVEAAAILIASAEKVQRQHNNGYPAIVEDPDEEPGHGYWEAGDYG